MILEGASESNLTDFSSAVNFYITEVPTRSVQFYQHTLLIQPIVLRVRLLRPSPCESFRDCTDVVGVFPVFKAEMIVSSAVLAVSP